MGYGRHTDPGQLEIQRLLIELLDVAGARAGVDRSRWHRQAKGDEELALVPVDSAAPLVIGDFCLELAAALHRHNLRPGPLGRLRLRLAADEGEVEQGANGFVGRAVVGATRLGSSREARQALEESQGTDLVVVLSDSVYRDWVDSGRGGLAREHFRRVRVREKETETDAWLWLPGASASAPGTPTGTGDTGGTPPVPPAAGGRTINMSGRFSTYIESGDNIHIGDEHH
ncbi:hypothetical protein [Catellatospora sp. TT07R-123]|uniref:hypothetical protein n=1 Tax=Catellatospora sp. TT07R-123 TaxID=2733863 RepID=UPI001BB3A34D|nr:hypothetical protein [Catellatospora sp. TT07R-123]